jgi:YfiH family protein
MKLEFYGAKIFLSEKADGDMRIGPGVGESNKITADRQQNFVHDHGGVHFDTFCVAGLVHGADVAEENERFMNSTWISVKGCDAMVTNRRGTVLGVGYADCPTVFIVDPKHHAVGIAHCGWKGLAKGILGNTLTTMRLEYGTEPHQAFAYVGPGIEHRCYEVGKEVYEQFKSTFGSESARPDGKWHLDLREVITKQLNMNGLRWIQYNTDCTFCELAPSGHHKYFSGRRHEHDPLQTNMAFITLTETFDLPL